MKWLRDREERNERIGRLRVTKINSKKFPLQEKFNRKLDKFGSRPYIATNLKFRGIENKFSFSGDHKPFGQEFRGHCYFSFFFFSLHIIYNHWDN